MGEFLKLLEKYGVLAPIRTIAVTVVALIAFIYLVIWIGNPYADDTQPAAEVASSWAPPPPAVSTTPNPTLPPGFPSMARAPKLIEVPDGAPQPVPTKFGLTYTVPAGEGWRASNDMVMGWTDSRGDIGGYGAVSDYGYNHCREHNGSTLADVGATGRNGVDIDTAARDAVGKAERIFADESENKPSVEIRGPFASQVSGRPAVRYTAVVTDIHQEYSCDPVRAEFDIIATPAYATAEVMIFMVKHNVALPNSLSDRDVDAIIGSLRKTDR